MPSRYVHIKACYDCGPIHIKFNIYTSGCVMDEQWDKFNIPQNTTHILTVELLGDQWAVKYFTSLEEALDSYKLHKKQFEDGDWIKITDLKRINKPISFSWYGVQWAWK